MASNDGQVQIRLIDWQKVDAGDGEGLNNNIHAALFKAKAMKKAEWIEFMSYSPDEKYLGVGSLSDSHAQKICCSHDNKIYLFDVQ